MDAVFSASTMNYSHSCILPNSLARYSVYSEPNQLFSVYSRPNQLFKHNEENYCFFIVASFVNDKSVRSGYLSERGEFGLQKPWV